MGALSVILGAMGAHALERILDEQSLQSFLTGVRYFTYQSFALILLGLFELIQKKSYSLPGWLMFSGAILFSGSIFFLVLLKHLGVAYGFLIPITPIGGVVIIAGWLSWFFATLKRK
jgi:uncharacterized membrane protein YgdD (TMEM256/DUF423 family)